jgi:hypothetical protein
MNSPGKLASTWFREDKRVLVTTLCCVSSTLGIFCGFLINPFLVDENATGDMYKHQVEIYLYVIFGINLAFNIPAMIFMKNRPANPPRYLDT